MRRYLEEHGEFHDLAISTLLLGQMVVAHYFLKKPPAKTAKRVPGLRPPAPYTISRWLMRGHSEGENQVHVCRAESVSSRRLDSKTSPMEALPDDLH